MDSQYFNGSDLITIGYPEGKIIGLAIKIVNTHFLNTDKEKVKALLIKLRQYPENFLDDEVLAPLAKAFIEEANRLLEEEQNIKLNTERLPYKIFGSEFIEPGALDQMDLAMRLPVTVAGALMPDAHQGYGLPIGGVLAVKNAVIPYGVGVDIGCRMALSVIDMPENYLLENISKFKRELIAFTKFGAGNAWAGKDKADHAVLERPEFRMNSFVYGLLDKAAEQLGTSGGGNHFVEWGILEVLHEDPQLNLKKGKYVSLLSHSGSRGFGATIAGHYTRIAKEKCKLPKEAINLAYLDLDSAEGAEYYTAMNLAGDYASACHEIIHNRLTKAIGGNVIAKVENHHNFAWKEKLNGEDVIVHRKGATPASKDVLGIIPGSMTAPGFLVRGKGDKSSVNSASHGAGRRMSRSAAIKTISREEMRNVLKEKGVTLVGAGLDEAPMAYKDIKQVMSAQTDLVDVLAEFTPKIVRMANDGSRED
jgi:tRNA-splicing ligase RtcB (3'-phosphate/5'-hydroxy nucleic acid ligase)